MSDGGQANVPVAVAERDGERVLVACAALVAGSVLCAFRAAGDAPGPGRHTLQIAADRHVWLSPQWLTYVQHGCEPNLALDVEAWQVRVLRPVAVGEALTAFYPATELQFAEPFECQCGALTCLGRIEGEVSVAPARWGERPMSRHVRVALQAQQP